MEAGDDAPREGAERYLPASRSLSALRQAARTCRGCDLWKRATQTVFGEGASHAALLLVGEQPGNAEDLEGRPFVGPAGKLLDRAIAEAEIDRRQVYVTNAVKHFKWEPRGKLRIHAKPGAREVAACRPWIEAEIAAIRPRVVVALGATAARALLGPSFSVMRQRGVPIERGAATVVATVHPAAVLRAPDGASREEATRLLIADLRVAADLARKRSTTGPRRVRRVPKSQG
jgi:DNA polymerase